MVIYILMGHPGVGKTRLLNCLEKYFKSKATYWDLDCFIEQSEGLVVEDIFQQFGESNFRQLEKIYFNKILDSIEESAQRVHFVAVGAGFQGDLSGDMKILWIQKEYCPQLDESLEKSYLSREKRFRQVYNEALMIPEGVDFNEKAMGFFFKDLWSQTEDHSLERWSLTIRPSCFRHNQFSTWAQKRLQWGVGFFEVRDDLLDLDQIEQVIQEIPRKKLIFSFREEDSDLFHMIIEKEKDISDWSLELGEPLDSHLRILSLYNRRGDVRESIEYLNSYPAAHYKLSVEIRNFEELTLGHHWWQQDPVNRTFLPRSLDGRWEGYRRVWGPEMLLSFFREEEEGKAKDQPLLLDVLFDLEVIRDLGPLREEIFERTI